MKQNRKIFGIILIAILIFLMIYSSLEHSKKRFDILYTLENYEKQDNKILITGEIVEINHTNEIIIFQLSEPPYSVNKNKIYNLESLDYIPKKGDIAEIFGIKNEKNNITGEKMFIF